MDIEPRICNTILEGGTPVKGRIIKAHNILTLGII
jgi:hypothetical protein